MEHSTILEIIIGLVLIALTVAILNPLHIWMPDMVHMSMMALLLVLFAAFAAFVVRERAVDEREVQVRMLSGRVGFLAGSAALVLGIALEGLHGQADPWLVTALLALLLGKIATHLYIDLKK